MSDTKYLIRKDKNVIYYTDTEAAALHVIERLSKDEVKNRETLGVKVFSRVLSEGKEIQVYTQALGVLMNGSVTKACIFDIMSVTKIEK